MKTVYHANPFRSFYRYQFIAKKKSEELLKEFSKMSCFLKFQWEMYGKAKHNTVFKTFNIGLICDLGAILQVLTLKTRKTKKLHQQKGESKHLKCKILCRYYYAICFFLLSIIFNYLLIGNLQLA